MNDRPEEVTSRPRDTETELDGRDVYWFVGGPLDGRVHTRAPDDPAPPVVRHTHLHDGPKIVHLYDLHEVAGHGGEYRLRRGADPVDCGRRHAVRSSGPPRSGVRFAHGAHTISPWDS